MLSFGAGVLRSLRAVCALDARGRLVLHETALDVLQVDGQGRHRGGRGLWLPSGIAEAVAEPFVPDRGHDLRGDGRAGGNQGGEVLHLRVILGVGRPEVHDAEQVVGIQAFGDGRAQACVLRGDGVHGAILEAFGATLLWGPVSHLHGMSGQVRSRAERAVRGFSDDTDAPPADRPLAHAEPGFLAGDFAAMFRGTAGPVGETGSFIYVRGGFWRVENGTRFPSAPSAIRKELWSDHVEEAPDRGGPPLRRPPWSLVLPRLSTFLGGNMMSASRPALEEPGELTAALTNLEDPGCSEHPRNQHRHVHNKQG